MPVAAELPSSLCHSPLSMQEEDGCPFYQCLALRCQQVHCQGVVLEKGSSCGKKKKKMTTTPSAHSQTLKNSET